MKNLLNFCFVFAVLFLFQYAHADETIRLAIGEWPPYLSEGSKHYGITAHIASEAFALEGVQVKYEFYPWARSMFLAERGTCEGTLIWIWTQERAEKFYYTDAFFTTKSGFIHLKDFKFNWQSFEDLKGLKIGASIGYFYGEPFRQAEDSGMLTVDRVAKEELNLQKLLYHRIDLYLTSFDVWYSLAKKHLTPDQQALLTNNPKVVNELPYHLLLSKKIKTGPELMAKFNAGLKKLQDSGKYDEMMLNFRSGYYDTP